MNTLRSAYRELLYATKELLDDIQETHLFGDPTAFERPKEPLAKATVSIALVPDQKPIVQEDFSDLKQLVGAVAPRLRVAAKPPSDAAARAHNQAWVESIALITTPCPPEHGEVLDRLTAAITDRLAPAKRVDATPWSKTEQWQQFLSAPNLKLVIVSETTLRKSPALFSFFQPPHGAPLAKLGEIPALITADLSVYCKQPSLKRGLWDVLTKNYQNL